MPKPQHDSAVSSGVFANDDFSYDAESDAYVCPGRQALKRRGRRKIRNTGLIQRRQSCRLQDMRPANALHQGWIPPNHPL